MTITQSHTISIWDLTFTDLKVSFVISPASSCVFWIGECEEVIVLVVLKFSIQPGNSL